MSIGQVLPNVVTTDFAAQVVVLARLRYSIGDHLVVINYGIKYFILV